MSAINNTNGGKRPRPAPAAFKVALDIDDFNGIVGEMKEFDEQRERVIKRSRDVQKLAKQAVFSLHRGNDAEAAQRLASAEAAAAELLPLVTETPALRGGSFSSAMEEYAEAVIFRAFLSDGCVARRADVPAANLEEYLGGVLDFTGELNRWAIARATERDAAAVSLARDIVEGLQGQFLRLDLRNGALRKKYDALKYTLKKLENTLYELSLTERGLAAKPEDVPDAVNGGGDAGGDDDL